MRCDGDSLVCVPHHSFRISVFTERSCKVSVTRLLSIFDALEVFSLDEILYTPLDEIDVGFESLAELRDDLGKKLLMAMLSARPNTRLVCLL